MAGSARSFVASAAVESPVLGDAARAPPGSEGQRRYTAMLEQLLGGILSSESSGELAQHVLALAVRLARVDVGVLLLREGSRLVARASCGLEDALVAALSLSLEQALGERPASVEPGLFEVADTSAIPSSERLARLHGLPLLHGGQPLGLVYLGQLRLDPRSPNSPPSIPCQGGDGASHAISGGEDRSLLEALAAPSAAALQQKLTHEALQRDVRLREDVLGVVAHDLQNPLNVISMAAHMLLQRVTDQASRRPIERIQHSTQRATRLLRDLLDVGAIERGHFAIERRRLDPASLILSALESQQSLAADASVITAADLSPELPPIDADEERLLEVLENLIGNAIKFTSAGGTITVGAERAHDEIKIWVADNGSGIPAQHLPYIFDRFWQANRANRRGTGLGLSICKGIVEAHGGRIWAESSVGKGTTVHFTIAAAAPESAYYPNNVSNILLVDDRQENLLALQSILERPDYRLVSAESGEKALRIALREHFAVALIDVAMPGMNGLEVATHLKALERSRDIPIIFVTAFGDDPEEIHRAYAAGGADYLVKPLDAEIVRKKVAVFVDLNRRQRSAAHILPEISTG